MSECCVTRPVVLLTGASSGIGEAAAHELKRRGYALVLAARRAERLEALARHLDPSGRWALAVRCDVAEPTDRQELVQRATERFGRIDALINNAGTSITRKMWWDAPNPLGVLRVNLEGPIELTRLVLPAMRHRKRGYIVNVASVAGLVPFQGIYSASKFGLRGFSLALRRELLGSGVHVSVVSPGFVRTELTANARLPMPGPERVARALADVLERPRREVVIPGAYRWAAALDSLFPGVMDKVMPQLQKRRYA